MDAYCKTVCLVFFDTIKLITCQENLSNIEVVFPKLTLIAVAIFSAQSHPHITFINK